MKTTLLKLLLLTFLACGAPRPAAASSTYSWVGGSGTPINDWNTPANWILSSAPPGNANFLPGPADIVDFSGAIANVWVDLASGPQTVSGLNFGPAPFFNLGSFATRTPALTLDAAGTINNAGGVAFIHTDLICGPSVGSATILLTGGPGQVYLTGHILNEPNLVANGGDYIISPPFGSGLILNNVTVNPGGWLQIGVTNRVEVRSPVNVNGGMLRLCNQASSPGGIFVAPSITVAAGATITVNALVASGTTIIGGTAGAGCSHGTFVHTGNLIFSSTATLNVELTTPVVAGGPNDYFNVGGDLTIAGIVNIIAPLGLVPGIYPFAACSGTLINNGLTLGSLPPGPNSYALSTAAGKVNLIVSLDTTPPTLVSATADCVNLKVTVVFSELLDAASAVDLFNYVISGGIQIQNVVLAADGKTVCLVIDPATPLLPSVTYTLTVNDVTDLAGNTIAPNPSQKQFACPPVITVQPQSQTVVVGASVTLTAAATGAGPLSYQWKFNGTNLSGKTNNTLPLTNFQLPNAGNYSVAVSSPIGGSITSAAAALAVAACTYSVSAPPGFSMIANQCNSTLAGGNTLNNVLPAVPNGSQIIKWNNTTQTWEPTATFNAGSWTPPTTLNPGSGAYFYNPTASAITLNFSGNLPTPVLPLTLPPSGCCIVSRQTPLPADVTDILGNSPQDQDVVYQFVNPPGSWSVHVYDASIGGWSPTDPMAKVGESIWICRGSTNSLPNLPCHPDTTPPVINCACLEMLAHNLLLTNACLAYIPDLCQFTNCFTDDCCLSNCMQTPVAGTIVPPGTYPITVTLTDCAGNTSACTLNFVVTSLSDTLYVTASDNKLYRIDNYQTPGSPLIQVANMMAFNDIAIDPATGNAWGIRYSPALMKNELFSIDLQTGATTSLGGVGPLNTAGWNSMTFANGLLYAGAGDLYSINPVTVQSTLLISGTTMMSGDLAYNPIDGRLYSANNSGANTFLVRYDLVNATATTVGNFSGSPNVGVFAGGLMFGLAFDASGRLFGTTSGGRLFEINPNTAAVTLVSTYSIFPQGAAARPGCRTNWACGMTVATCYSDSRANATTDQCQNIPGAGDPNGFVVAIFDTRLPLPPPNPPSGKLWTSAQFSGYHGESGLPQNQFRRVNLGEVFGLALDNATPASIYVAATSLYPGDTFGPAGPGGVYKIDGATLTITPIASVPNASPVSLGNICFDPVNNQLFVVNLNDGLIHRMTTAGTLLGTPYDHGLQTAVPPVPDVNSVPGGITQPGRLPFAVGVHAGCLFYSLYTINAAPGCGQRSEIWSVKLDSTGNFVPGSGQLEYQVPAPVCNGYGGNSPVLVTDIAFSPNGKLLLSERDVCLTGPFQVNLATAAHHARLIELEKPGLTWVQSSLNTSVNGIPVGCSPFANSAGGCDYDCNSGIYVMGDALAAPGGPPCALMAPDNPGAFVYGIEFLPPGVNNKGSAYFIDLNNNTSNYDKNFLGDVEHYRCCDCCIKITNKSVECVDTNMTYQWDFCITNCWTESIKYFSFLDLPPGVTLNEDIITLPLPLAPGQGTCLTLYLTNKSGLEFTNLCFTVGAHTTNFNVCCSVIHCLTLPPCCVWISNDVATPITGQPNCYTYNPGMIKNLSLVPVKYLFLVPQPDAPNNTFSFSPNVITFNPPLLPNQTPVPGQMSPSTLKLTVNPGAPMPLCFLASLHDSNLVNCCSVRKYITSVKRPIDFPDGFDGSVFLAGSDIRVPVNIDRSVVGASMLKLYCDGETNATTTIMNPTDGLHYFVLSNAPPDVHIFVWTLMDQLGGLWSTDPARVYAVGPQIPMPAPLLFVPAAALNAGQVRFLLPTEPGVTCHVEYTESLSPANWQVFRTIVGDGTTVTITDSITNGPQRFFRVRMQ